MFQIFRSRYKEHPLLVDFGFAIIFGAISLLLGELRIAIPGVEGGYSDFREIPLIISAFYIRNPLFLVLAAVITSIELHVGYEGSYVTTFLMHIFPMIITWAAFQYTNKKDWPLLQKGLIWIFYIVIYYSFLLIPIMIKVDQFLGLNTDDFFESYIIIMESMKFELAATALVTALYLIQIENRKRLKEHRLNLEGLVATRTEELASANRKLLELNNELQSSSNEIKSMNINLDGLVKTRSKKIEDQLSLLVKYAHMNSHEVRAPLARILGLLEIIKIEKSVSQGDDIVKELCNSGVELDEVVRKMNRLLEEEIPDEEK